METLEGRTPLGVPFTAPRKKENIERTTKTFARTRESVTFV